MKKKTEDTNPEEPQQINEEFATPVVESPEEIKPKRSYRKRSPKEAEAVQPAQGVDKATVDGLVAVISVTMGRFLEPELAPAEKEALSGALKPVIDKYGGEMLPYWQEINLGLVVIAIVLPRISAKKEKNAKMSEL